MVVRRAGGVSAHLGVSVHLKVNVRHAVNGRNGLRVLIGVSVHRVAIEVIVLSVRPGKNGQSARPAKNAMSVLPGMRGMSAANLRLGVKCSCPNRTKKMIVPA